VEVEHARNAAKLDRGFVRFQRVAQCKAIVAATAWQDLSGRQHRSWRFDGWIATISR
jgi:hypothetical protein